MARLPPRRQHVRQSPRRPPQRPRMVQHSPAPQPQRRLPHPRTPTQQPLRALVARSRQQGKSATQRPRRRQRKRRSLAQSGRIAVIKTMATATSDASSVGDAKNNTQRRYCEARLLPKAASTSAFRLELRQQVLDPLGRLSSGTPLVPPSLDGGGPHCRNVPHLQSGGHLTSSTLSSWASTDIPPFAKSPENQPPAVWRKEDAASRTARCAGEAGAMANDCARLVAWATVALRPRDDFGWGMSSAGGLLSGGWWVSGGLASGGWWVSGGLVTSSYFPHRLRLMCMTGGARAHRGQ